MSAIKNIIRGDNHNIVVTFYESDGVTPIDLTGASVFFTASASSAPADDSAAVIQKTVTSHTDALGGTTTIALEPEDTDVDPGTYYYDVQLVDSDGNVLSSRQNTLVIKADITRRVA
jgi:hypothetical protein